MAAPRTTSQKQRQLEALRRKQPTTQAYLKSIVPMLERIMPVVDLHPILDGPAMRGMDVVMGEIFTRTGLPNELFRRMARKHAQRTQAASPLRPAADQEGAVAP